MRITITLQETDGALFQSVREAAGMEFVEPAVYARHLFLAGLKSVALSHDSSERLMKAVPLLAAAAKKRRAKKRKARR